MKILPALKPPINVRSLAVNTAAMWAETISAVIIMLWLTPLLKDTFGKDGFGLWRVASAVLMVMITLDLGMQIANHRFLSNHIVTASRGDLYRLLNSSLAIDLVLSGILLAVMFALGYLMPAVQEIGGQQQVIYRQTIWLLGICIPLMLLRFPFQSVVLAMQVSYKLAIARTIGQAVFAALAGAAIYSGWCDLRLIAAAMAANYFITLALTCIQAYQCLGAMPVSRRWVNGQSVRQMIRFGVDVFALPLSIILMYQLDPIMVGVTLNETQVAIFAPATMIALQVRMLSTGVGAPLLSVAAQLSAEGKHELLAELYHSAARLTGTLTVCFLLPMTIFGESFMRCWMGNDFAWTWQILAVLSLGQLAALTSYPGERMLVGSGRVKLAAWSSLLAGVAKVGLGMAALALTTWPLMGLAWATTLPLIVLQGFIFPLCFCRQIGVPLGRYTMDTLGRIVLSALPVAAVMLAIRHYWPVHTFVESLAQLAVGFALTAAAGWVITFTSKDRTYLLSMLRRGKNNAGVEK